MSENAEFVILLDLGRVVVDLMLDDWSRTVCPADPDHAINTFWHSSDKRAADIGIQSPDVLLQRMVADPNTSLESLAQAQQVWQEIFTPVAGSEAAVRWLLMTFPVWIASDTDPLHFAYINRRFDFLSGVPRSFVSFEIGNTKDEPGFFEAIIDASHVPSEQLVLVDDRDVNCNRARSLGMQAVAFQNWSQARADLVAITGQT